VVRERSTILRCWTAGLAAGLGMLAIALPASAAPAGTGGANAPGATGATGPVASGALGVAPQTLLLGQAVTVSGSVPEAEGGRAVGLEVRSAERSWVTVAHVLAAADGDFAITWRPTRSGEFQLRALGTAGTQATAVAASAGGAVATVLVYGQVLASWYGPGFYGKRTACGEVMTAHILGVADRTLPCGTPVSLSYNGIQVTVPVIDRGPYTNGVTLDLSHGLAQELGVTTTEPVGMAVLGGPAIAPSIWTGTSSIGPGGATGATAATGPTSLAGGASIPHG
jgi:rare lipoprotein A